MPRNTGKTVQKAPVKEPVAVVADENKSVVEETTIQAKAEKARTPYRVKQTLPADMVITVRNGFNGKLIYKSQKTGERFVWEEFGDEQDMELQELKNARNSKKGFFENNWFLIDDPAVIEYLGVDRFYKNALTYDDFDTLFEMSAEEIRERVDKLSGGQKASVVYRAKQLIKEGVIDSIKVIDALEKSLGVELIER